MALRFFLNSLFTTTLLLFSSPESPLRNEVAPRTEIHPVVYKSSKLFDTKHIQMTGLFTGIVYNIFLPQELALDALAILSWENTDNPIKQHAKWVYAKESMKPFLAGGPLERNAQFVFSPKIVMVTPRGFYDLKYPLLNLGLIDSKLSPSVFNDSSVKILGFIEQRSYEYFWLPRPHYMDKVRDAYILTSDHAEHNMSAYYTVGDYIYSFSDYKHYEKFREDQRKQAEADGRAFRATDAFQFIPANFTFKAQIVNLEYPTDAMEQLRNQSKEVILGATHEINNPTNVKINGSYDISKSKTSTISYGFTKSLKLFTSIAIEAGIPLITTARKTAAGQINLDSNQQWTSSETETYKVSKEIFVPPQSSMVATSYINWVNDMRINFVATMEVTMQILRVTETLDVVQKDAPADVVEKYLKYVQYYAPDLELVGWIGDKIQVKTNGTISGQIGLGTFVVARELPV